MGIKMAYHENESLQVVVDDVLKDIELTEDEVMKVMKTKLRQIAVDETRRLKRIKNIRPERFRKNGEKRRNKHLYQDVVVKEDKDKYGHKVLRVRGGAQTGGYWHIVNDGTYRTKATHFMDKIVDRAGAELEAITERELKKRSE